MGGGSGGADAPPGISLVYVFLSSLRILNSLETACQVAARSMASTKETWQPGRAAASQDWQDDLWTAWLLHGWLPGLAGTCSLGCLLFSAFSVFSGGQFAWTISPRQLITHCYVYIYTHMGREMPTLMYRNNQKYYTSMLTVA